MLHEFWQNFTHNLFKPLLLFFYMGFSVPLLKVPFEFPHVLYQGLTIYLLIAIGWHGGEELATLSSHELAHAGGFMVIGFFTNLLIGLSCYVLLRSTTRLRRVDAATVAGYYGSDSAGTFVTCVGVLTAAQLAFAPYMPVLLAVMEIPGCLVALFLVSRLRQKGMDDHGNMPDEQGYKAPVHEEEESGYEESRSRVRPLRSRTISDGSTMTAVAHGTTHGGTATMARPGIVNNSHSREGTNGFASFVNWQLLHEVFLNPGLYLLFGGIVIGLVSRLQGEKVTAPDDQLFVVLFQGALCLFLLEMGMTACKRLKDLKTAGWRFILFALLAPNIFATIGIVIAHLYSHALGESFAVGTYVLFAVLCAAASYIAVPAVQRLAIPEASPTLPLAASLGLTFSYNVTIGIPVYILIAKSVIATFPITT